MIKKTKKATEDTLNELHGLIGKTIMQLIKEDPTNMKAIDLGLKYLKDNAVAADLEYNEALQEVKQLVDVNTLPFPKIN